jgi:hypothetical protein
VQLHALTAVSHVTEHFNNQGTEQNPWSSTNQESENRISSTNQVEAACRFNLSLVFILKLVYGVATVFNEKCYRYFQKSKQSALLSLNV